MTKTLKKAIMTRSRLKNKYLKTKSLADCCAYKRQRNYCSHLYRKTRQQYFKNLNIADAHDSKAFWRIANTFISDKGNTKSKISLIDNGDIVSDEATIAEVLNKYFRDAVLSIDLNMPTHNVLNASSSSLTQTLKGFEAHPSIAKIKENVKPGICIFPSVSIDDIDFHIRNMDGKKACSLDSIPPRALKESIHISCKYLSNIINNCITSNVFPDELKRADITPIHKKDETTNKQNYRPISILPAVSKIFEKLLFKYISDYIQTYLSPYLCGFRCGFNAQHALLAMIDKWKSELDKRGYAGAVLMDLSKAFDTVNHDLLLAKMHAYGFDTTALALLKSYLTERLQRVKVNASYSSWTQLLLGVPQGSVLGPLLFNIYINDLFLFITGCHVCNYADDTTLHASGPSLEEVLETLEQQSSLVLEWFRSNYMKLNEDKCYMIVSGTKHEHAFIKIGQELIWESQKQSLLGVIFDKELSFKLHIKTLCNEASKKVNALARLSYVLDTDKLKLLMHGCIDSIFNSYPLVWAFHGSRKLNARINRIHERGLRIVYKDNGSPFHELLTRDGSVTVHQRHLRCIVIEMFKTKNGISPPFMDAIFSARNMPYALRSNTDFQAFSVKTVFHGTETLKFMASSTWNLLPSDIANLNTLSSFKKSVKRWIPQGCSCRLCKTFVASVGFI